jgi:hypothetical protein
MRGSLAPSLPPNFARGQVLRLFHSHTLYPPSSRPPKVGRREAAERDPPLTREAPSVVREEEGDGTN